MFLDPAIVTGLSGLVNKAVVHNSPLSSQDRHPGERQKTMDRRTNNSALSNAPSKYFLIPCLCLLRSKINTEYTVKNGGNGPVDIVFFRGSNRISHSFQRQI